MNTKEESLFYYIQFNYKVICYCLMDNHVHLMIKTDIEPLGKLMGRIMHHIQDILIKFKKVTKLMLPMINMVMFIFHRT